MQHVVTFGFDLTPSTRGGTGIEQKPTWGKQPNHAIDTLSYLLAKVHRPMASGEMRAPTTGLVKPFYPGLGV